MIEKIKECIASGDLVLAGIGDECSLKHHTKEELQTFYEKLADLLEEKEYLIGPFKFNVIINSGHTTDSISFYFREEKVMFVGDFIFLDSIGRCDLEGGNFSSMRESIKKIKAYADDIVIFPGHGDKTTLGYEKENNYYFN